MAGKAKLRRRPAWLPRTLESHLAQAGFDWIPENPSLLRVVVGALIERMKRTVTKNPRQAVREAQHLVIILQHTRALEMQAGLDMTPDNLSELCQSSGELIMTEKCPNYPHHPFALRQQRRWLLISFKTKGYQDLSDSPQQEWVAAHAKEIYLFMQPWQCFCEYPPSLNGLFGNTKKRPIELTGEWDERIKKYTLPTMQAIRIILAYMHNVKSETQIENLLKPVPYFMRRKTSDRKAKK